MKTGKIKYCVGCNIVRTELNTDVMTHGYFRGRCKVCFKISGKIYEKTLQGYLVRVYRNMKSRISGIQKNKAHLYKGKSLLSKDSFYKWSLKSEEYLTLHSTWVLSNHCYKLAPSIDRVDSSLGYQENNIRWITQSENSRLGAISRHSIKSYKP